MYDCCGGAPDPRLPQLAEGLTALPPDCRLDNSEWMRNGDFVPTRIEQQFDAFSRVADAKLRHPESMLGLMTMAGKT